MHQGQMTMGFASVLCALYLAGCAPKTPTYGLCSVPHDTPKAAQSGYIDEEGNLIDVDGNRVNEEGDYEFKRQPFLDDDGKPIEEAKEESEPEPQEEVKAEDSEEKEEAEVNE